MKLYYKSEKLVLNDASGFCKGNLICLALSVPYYLITKREGNTLWVRERYFWERFLNI